MPVPEPTSKEKIAQIQDLRNQGFSYDYIANKLDISKSTAQKYAPGGVVKRQESKKHKERFTERQLQIAIFVLENSKNREKIPSNYWVK
jgi:DNA invertase Pin-like site-specific DNA recombinase